MRKLLGALRLAPAGPSSGRYQGFRRARRSVSQGRSRLAFERRIVVLSVALTAPALALGGWLIWRLELEWIWRGVAAAALLAILAGLGAALRKSVIQPLRGLTNVVAAYRSGDYTIRSSRERPGDALGDLVHEVNSLGDTLHQQRLRALEATALLDKLINAIDIAVLAFDGEGRLRVHNPAATQLLGFESRTGAGRTAAEMGLEEFLQGDTRSRIVTSLGSRSGRWQVTHGTFRESGLAQHLLIIFDLRQALREEERLAWQRLIRVIGHEVNNSLSPIRSLATTLQESLSAALTPGNDRDEALTGLKVIADRTHNLSRFLAQYSRLARLPSPCPRWLVLAPVFARVIALEPLHRIQIQVPENLEAHVDEDQLEQALMNLARNAVEAQGVCAGQVLIAAHGYDDTLVITITDEGPGVANPDNLFVPFFTTKPGGSGVGLVLSRQIAEAHGGTLSLENRHDTHGAIATLEIPGAVRKKAANRN
jgi:two-component system, NtrC family, nitrogen regulation sensor histidine kinase NtrY